MILNTSTRLLLGVIYGILYMFYMWLIRHLYMSKIYTPCHWKVTLVAFEVV